MNDIKQLFNRLSLRSIILIFCLPFIFLVIIACFAFYTLGTRQISDMIHSNAENIVEQTNNSFEDTLDQVYRLTSTMTSSYLFYQLMSNVATDRNAITPNDFYRLSTQLTNFYTQNPNYFDSIMLYLNDSSILYYKSKSNAVIHRLDFQYEEYRQYYSNSTPNWIVPTQLMPYKQLNTNPSPMGLIQLIGSGDSKIQGFFMVELNKDLLLKEVKNCRITPSSFVTITQKGRVLFDNPDVSARPDLNTLTFADKQYIEQQIEINPNLGTMSFNTGDFYVFYHAASIDSLGILAVIPLDEMYLDQAYFGRLLTIIISIVLCTGITLYLITYRVLSKPVHVLVKKMEQVSADRLDVPFDVVGSKEIMVINDGIRNLLAHIRQLIQSLNLEMDRKRNAELKVLHAQINPHFLYNTLDSISQLCDIGETLRAKAMTNDLAMFYRIGVSKGMDEIPLGQELTHIETYMSILKTRYEDFQYIINVPSEYKQCSIVKITLQPLVENAICHGIRPLRSGGTITVSAAQSGGCLVLKVIDDGIGMTDEMLSEIRTSMQDPLLERETRSKIYGIKNVHDRLYLTYGPSYGLTIDSIMDMGTTITVIIPYCHHKEGEQVYD